MEVRQLKTFATIARLASFVQAAEELGYAQSTITSHIQALENELGVRLFERLGHTIRLTGPGRALLPYAEQVTRLVAEALEIAAHPDVPQGTLTIGTGESLGTYRLPGLLRTYRAAFPQVELALKFANCGAVREALRDNGLDVGLIISERTADADLIVEELSAETMLFLAAPDHPLARKSRVRPEDLGESCLILTEPGCSYRATVTKILQDFRVTPLSLLEASSIEAIKQLIMIGMGVAMLPQFSVAAELAEGRIRALSWAGPVPGYSVQLLHHKDKWRSPALRSFWDTARRYWRDPQPPHAAATPAG
jgi:DNA-binding transcriptional LysR family regulator